MPFHTVQGVYDDLMLAILQQAYEEACREIGVDPKPADPLPGKPTRDALASAIMSVAAAGERDPRLLREKALRMNGWQLLDEA